MNIICDVLCLIYSVKTQDCTGFINIYQFTIDSLHNYLLKI